VVPAFVGAAVGAAVVGCVAAAVVFALVGATVVGFGLLLASFLMTVGLGVDFGGFVGEVGDGEVCFVLGLFVVAPVVGDGESSATLSLFSAEFVVGLLVGAFVGVGVLPVGVGVFPVGVGVFPVGVGDPSSDFLSVLVSSAGDMSLAARPASGESLLTSLSFLSPSSEGAASKAGSDGAASLAGSSSSRGLGQVGPMNKNRRSM